MLQSKNKKKIGQPYSFPIHRLSKVQSCLQFPYQCLCWYQYLDNLSTHSHTHVLTSEGTIKYVCFLNSTPGEKQNKSYHLIGFKYPAQVIQLNLNCRNEIQVGGCWYLQFGITHM